MEKLAIQGQVEHGDLMAFASQVADHIGTNKTGTASDQVIHPSLLVGLVQLYRERWPCSSTLRERPTSYKMIGNEPCAAPTAVYRCYQNSREAGLGTAGARCLVGVWVDAHRL